MAIVVNRAPVLTLWACVVGLDPTVVSPGAKSAAAAPTGACGLALRAVPGAIAQRSP